MKSPRNIARLFSLTLTLVGLMSWNTLATHSSSQTAQAATNASLTKLTDQPGSRAVANGKIAFTSISRQGLRHREIHTMNPDGSDRIRLTFSQGDEKNTGPAWSPDGTQIAFVRTSGSIQGFESYRGEIFVMNADGSNQRRLTQSTTATEDPPTWSPDGTRIAFSIYPCRGCDTNVYVMNADGSDQRLISRSDSQPAWSPDGSKLAATGTDRRIYLMNVDGSDRVAITTPSAWYEEDSLPAWSPDGSKIGFTRWSGCDFNDCTDVSIWTVNGEGSSPTKLLNAYALRWSPDGTKIILHGGGGFSVMNADGSGITNITQPNDELDYDPSWQPLFLTSCADSVSPAGQSFEANGGTGSVDVTAGSECVWTATSYSGWITIASGNTSGNGSVVYSVAANTSTSPRTATIIIAARSFTVTQAGAAVTITGASVAGKKLIVLGENFDPGAVILLSGEEQITKNDGQNPQTALIGKKAGKKIQPGDKLQVRNPNGSLSQEFTFSSM